MADEPKKPVNSSNDPVNGDSSNEFHNSLEKRLSEYDVKRKQVPISTKLKQIRGKTLRSESRDIDKEKAELEKDRKYGIFVENEGLYELPDAEYNRRLNDLKARAEVNRIKHTQLSASVHGDWQKQDLIAQASLKTSTRSMMSGVNTRHRISSIETHSESIGKVASRIHGGATFFDFEAEKGAAISKRSELEEKLKGVLSKPKVNISELREIAGEISMTERGQAIAERGEKFLRKSGLTPENQLLRTQDVLNRANKQNTIDEATSKSGQADFDLKDVDKGIKRLQDSLKDLYKSFEDGKTSLKDFTNTSKEMNDELENLEHKRSGIIKGGGGSFFNKYGGVLEGAAFLGRSVANIASNANNIVGNQDIAQMNNRAAFAARANQMFFKAENAVMGNDVDAAIDLMSTSPFAKQYADRNRRLAHGAGWTGAIGNSIGNIAGGAAVGAGIGATGGGALGLLFGGIGAIPAAAGGALVGGIAGTISGLSSSISEMSDLGYENVGADASLRSIAAIQGLSDESRRIKTFQMQKYYSQNLNTYTGGMGMGGMQALGMQQSLTDKATLNAIAMTGVGHDQAVSLSSMLSNAGNFGGAAAGVDIIKSAGLAGQRGQMTREGYTGAAARLISMGGGNNELQDIITKGMENAKNINQMVDASISLSSGLASIGVSGTASTSKMLSSSVQDLMALGVNSNLAPGVAASSMENLSNALQSKGMTFGNIMERGMLRQNTDLRNAKVHQMNALSEMSLQDIGVLRAAESGNEKDITAARILAQRKGISGLVFGEDGKIKSGVVNTAADAALTGAIVDVGGAQYARSMIEKTKSGKDLSDQENAIANQIRTDQSSMRRLYHSDAIKIDQQENKINGVGAERTGAFRGLANLFMGEDFAKSLNTDQTGYKNIEDMMTMINQAIDPTEFSKTIVKAAGDFSEPVLKFGTHINTLGTILDTHAKMLKSMGESRAPSSGDTIPSDLIPNRKK